MTPPRRASSAACRMAAREAVAGVNAATWPMPTLASANACRAVVLPSASSITSTPPASVGDAVESALRCSRKARPSRRHLHLLRRRVLHQCLGMGKEERRADRLRPRAARAHVQRQPLGPHLHARGPRRGLRQGCPRRIEERACARIDAGRHAGARNRQSERQARLARYALLLAHQPRDMRSQVDGRAGNNGGGRHDAGEQHRLALIAEIDKVGDGDAAGRRPDDGIGGKARRQRPGNGDRFPGVAGVAPVDVPALLDAQAQAHPECLPGGNGRRLGDELCLHQLAHRRRSTCCALPREDSQRQRDGAAHTRQAHQRVRRVGGFVRHGNGDVGLDGPRKQVRPAHNSVSPGCLADPRAQTVVAEESHAAQAPLPLAGRGRG